MNDMTSLLPHIKLRFNIEHPSFEECYAHGYECAQGEISEAENPYRLNSKESDHWLEGWWAGFYGEQPLHEVTVSDAEEAKTIPTEAANDHSFHHYLDSFLVKVMEVSGVIAVSAAVGYQVIDLVA